VIKIQTTIYTLPEFTFVGGKTQQLVFNLKDENGEPYNAYGCKIDFSICDYSNKTGTPCLSIAPTLLTGATGEASILSVNIAAKDTVSLYGKYIYQITIIDINGKTEIPNQGIMNITRNINESFIS
jgi:hypothetical protein